MALKYRDLEHKDVETVFAMCRAMAEESPNYRGVAFSEKKVRALLSQILLSWLSPMLGVVVEAEDGQLVAMLGATVYEEYMSEDKFATDIVLYVHPDHRGGSIIVRLVKLYEDWALRNGVKPENTKLSVGTGVEVERTVRIFERLGYKLNSYNMVKDKANV